MTTALRVSQSGRLVLVAPITQMYARSLALMSMALANHLVEHPEHAPALLGRVVLTVEDALQTNREAHQIWMGLYDAGHSLPVEIEVLGLTDDADENGVIGAGGAGGKGGWPGGGGGGGGNGNESGGTGGDGAGGALALLLFDKDGVAVDIEVMVTEGKWNWICQAGVSSAKAILIGGGGGGASGAKDDWFDPTLYQIRSLYSIRYLVSAGTQTQQPAKHSFDSLSAGARGFIHAKEASFT